ncbi:hypothetical protein [Halovenus salina]|uniref:DUF1211 domain-containing protein n=1 Tax=Halovenus salina TaxID=1510225 RepID=A0ABD5W5J6_9EURY|nr:hypothetical protein [Halovenus salina]
MTDREYEASFLKRLGKLEVSSFIKSYDTFAAVLSIPIIYIITDGGITRETGADLLLNFSVVSASLFAIILTGLTIITSFTDKTFLYTWQKVGEFENLVTYFQYNLILPIILNLLSLILYIEYQEEVMILLTGFFVYLLFSLYHLIALVCRYALQRGEFIRQEMESTPQPQSDKSDSLSDEELKQIYGLLNELKEE